MGDLANELTFDILQRIIFILFKYTLPFILRGWLCLKYSVRSYIIYVHLWLKLLKHARK